MTFKKDKRTGIVINTDNFDEYQKNRRAILKAQKAKNTQQEKKVSKLENEVSELRNMIKEYIECQK